MPGYLEALKTELASAEQRAAGVIGQIEAATTKGAKAALQDLADELSKAVDDVRAEIGRLSKSSADAPKAFTPFAPKENAAAVAPPEHTAA